MESWSLQLGSVGYPSYLSCDIHPFAGVRGQDSWHSDDDNFITFFPPIDTKSCLNRTESMVPEHAEVDANDLRWVFLELQLRSPSICILSTRRYMGRDVLVIKKKQFKPL